MRFLKLFIAKKKYIRVAFIILIFICATLFYLLTEKNLLGDRDYKNAATITIKKDDEQENSKRNQSKDGTDSKLSKEQKEDFIFVDVDGAVRTPGLYKLPKKSRVMDAINAAGGLTSDANSSMINRAATIRDGEKIFIQSGDATTPQNAGENANYSTNYSRLININSADSLTLQTLPGIGPAMAMRIVEFRNNNGRFSRIEDLKKVKGIGNKLFDKIKEKISIG